MKSLGLRILLSLIIGGVLQEVLRIITGKEVRLISFIGAVTAFILISVFVYLHRTITLQRKVDNQLKQNDELIDDLK